MQMVHYATLLAQTPTSALFHISLWKDIGELTHFTAEAIAPNEHLTPVLWSCHSGVGMIPESFHTSTTSEWNVNEMVAALGGMGMELDTLCLEWSENGIGSVQTQTVFIFC